MSGADAGSLPVRRTISVLIPTIGREKELIETVRALARQTVAPDEIVVVDQNDPPIPAVDRALAGIPIVRHLRSPERGVAANVNVAIREARGEVLLFLDDDVVPATHLVERHLSHYAGGTAPPGLTGVAGVAGRVETPAGGRDAGGRDPRAIGRFHRWTGRVTAGFDARRPAEVEIAQGCNMSLARAAVVAAGGSDPGFDGNGYFWETDLCLRVRRAGGRIVFDPGAEVLHLMAPSGGARMPDKALHTYYSMKNGVRLCRRHSPRGAAAIYLPRMAGYVALKALYNRSPRILAMGFRGLYRGLRRTGARWPADA